MVRLSVAEHNRFNILRAGWLCVSELKYWSRNLTAAIEQRVSVFKMFGNYRA